MLIRVSEVSGILIRNKNTNDFDIAHVDEAFDIAQANGCLSIQEFAQKYDQKELEIDGKKKIVDLTPAEEDTATMTEMEMVKSFKDAEETLKKMQIDFDAQFKPIKEKRDKLELQLIDYLEEEGKKSSAKYEGIGHVTRVEGQAYASIKEGCQPIVLDHFRSIGRDDMIKTSIHSATLTSFVNQCLKTNEALPDGVTYYRNKSIRFTPAK